LFISLKLNTKNEKICMGENPKLAILIIIGLVFMFRT